MGRAQHNRITVRVRSLVLLLSALSPALAPIAAFGLQNAPTPQAAAPAGQGSPDSSGGSSAGTDLQQGIELTRTAHFAEAIPLLQHAAAQGAQPYVASFDLAICYIGSGRYADALPLLHTLAQARDSAPVQNLLAQAYLGNAQPDQAWTAMQAAAKLAPDDERMYALLADACSDHYQYRLGLRIVDLGLAALPTSARLHYARALFLAELDRLDEARPEFLAAEKFGAGADIGYLASAQLDLYDLRFDRAAATVRSAIKTGDRSAEMLALLGSILLRAGAAPGQPAFDEARQSLEAAVALAPTSASAQIALGTLYLRGGQPVQALPHLEAGRRMEPSNPDVLTELAHAYRSLGNRAAAAQCMQQVGQLVAEEQASHTRHP